jgi:uncharacterized integral membrane protein
MGGYVCDMSNPQQPGDLPPRGVPPTPPPPPGAGQPVPAAPSTQPAQQDRAAQQGRATQKPAKQSRFSTGQLLGGILFVIVIVFVLENTRSVKVRLLIPEVTTPLAVPILIAAVLGALVAWLLRYRRHRRHKAAPPQP